jgi:tRNA1Val (adenine37-N6)-methyltransferase
VIDRRPLAITHGSLFDGGVAFAQLATGYRAAIDGLLLALFAPAARDLAADLGAGAGMVSLGLLTHGRASSVLAVEQQPDLCEVLRLNLAANGWLERARVIEGSVDQVARAHRGSADVIVANPPYFRLASSTRGTDPAAEPALRAEDPLGPFVRAARLLLGRGGRACWIYPARELALLLSALSSRDLHPRRMTFVHPRVGASATRVLVECSAGRSGGLHVEPPWVLYEHPERSDAAVESAILRRATRRVEQGLDGSSGTI